jgi:hypothetical protein
MKTRRAEQVENKTGGLRAAEDDEGSYESSRDHKDKGEG